MLQAKVRALWSFTVLLQGTVLGLFQKLNARNNLLLLTLVCALIHYMLPLFFLSLLLRLKLGGNLTLLYLRRFKENKLHFRIMFVYIYVRNLYSEFPIFQPSRQHKSYYDENHLIISG